MALHPELAPVAIISALSLFLPLPWHWRSRNVATLSLILWLFLSNIVFGVNALMWSEGVRIRAAIWCDISTKLIIGANVALPTACLCICIHLEQVASVRHAHTSIGAKRRRQWFEAVMCFGLPMVFMALHYIVQGHRFDIIEGYGCRPTTYYSIPGIFIVWLPPVVISSIAIVFAGLALRHFLKRRLSFAAHLNASNTALTTSRYLRLMTMAALQMVWSISVTSFSMWFTASFVPLRPWTTWDDVHFEFSRIDVFIDVLTPPLLRQAYYTLWWVVPVSTWLFVAFFSFGKDAMDEYRKCFVWFRVNVLRQSPTNGLKGLTMSHVKIRAIPISNVKQPFSPQSTTQSTFTATTLAPPYSAGESSIFAVQQKQKQIELESDYSSVYSLHDPPPLGYKGPKAIGSYSDLSIITPSVMHICTENNEKPLPPIQPLTPPPPNPRLRELILTPSSLPSPSRPLTYPSFDASHRGILSSNLISPSNSP
ncbi:hypothetical protein CVT24_001962 [Panaeolus cyanescens]|uniref:Uncharacterized protein n=1 Tax=Panaeolus cyanescens TaxID=181874 RepID=A0A409YHR7_9AGAR|nr:hypothetical protein CVT24_001962 [Panaeolus cyanescens]